MSDDIVVKAVGGAGAGGERTAVGTAGERRDGRESGRESGQAEVRADIAEAAATAGSEPPAPAPPPLRANRDYLLWFTGTSLSALGTALTQIALPLLLLAQTGSAAQAGAARAVSFLATVVVALPGGVVADRLSRRTVLVSCSSVELVAVGSVAVAAWHGRIQLMHVLVVAAVQGASGAFYSSAAAPSLVRIVGKANLARAYGNGHGRQALIELVGGPLGILLFSVAVWLPFLVDSGSFLAVVTAGMLLRSDLGPDAEEIAARDVTARGAWRRDIMAGLRFVWRWPTIRFTLLFGGGINALFSGYDLLVILLIRDRHGSDGDLALCMFLIGVAMLGSSVLAPALLQVISGRRLFCVTFALVAILAVATSAAPRPWEIGVLTAVVVMSTVPFNVFINAWDAKAVPDALMGRYSAAANAVTQSLMWLGPLILGLAAQRFGPGPVIAALGIVLAVVMAGAAFTPALRGLDGEPVPPVLD